MLLLGPSGAGKSTLLTALAGLLDPATGGEPEGALLVDGLDPRTARAQHAPAGLLLQDPQSQLVMARSGDDVAFGLENRGVARSEIWARVDEALTLVGFPYGRERATSSLSGGEAQRLALAGVVALRPGLVLLDEPTANLDPAGAELVRTALARVLAATGATLVVVEHRVATWLDTVDRIVVLGVGAGVVADGPPAEVLRAQAGPLSAAGVWVPACPPRPPARNPGARGDALVLTSSLAYAYRGDPAVMRPPDLALHAGEVLAVTGPNGSGKSTLALLAAGLLRPEQGRAVATPALSADGRPLWRWRARALAQHVGTVFQRPEHQFLTSDVRSEVALGPLLTGCRPARARALADELLVRLRLDRLAAANPFTLSGGEKRRLSVATALAVAPRVLVLDEPTFGQDRLTFEELLALLAALRDEGRALCVVTHDEAFTTALADRRLELAPTTAPAP